MEERRSVLFVVRVLINDVTCFKDFFIYVYKIIRFGISHFIINTLFLTEILQFYFQRFFFFCVRLWDRLVFEALYLFRKFGIIFYVSISDHYLIQS
jgi:hypothetical protein